MDTLPWTVAEAEDPVRAGVCAAELRYSFLGFEQQHVQHTVCVCVRLDHPFAGVRPPREKRSSIIPDSLTI